LTATKLHISPDETDTAWSQSLFQKRDFDSVPKPGLRGLQLHTPGYSNALPWC